MAVIARIDRVSHRDREAAHSFHASTLGDFVLPLSRERLFAIIDAGRLLAVWLGGELTGLCYLTPDSKGLDETPRWEMGGLYLTPAARGHGLATTLLRIAVAEAVHTSPRPVMGYVHQENDEVRGVLLRLGFTPTGRTVRLGPHEARGFLRRDAAGVATADVLTMPPAALLALADWLETFDGTTSGDGVTLTLADGLLQPSRAEIAAAVRRRSSAARTLP